MEKNNPADTRTNVNDQPFGLRSFGTLFILYTENDNL